MSMALTLGALVGSLLAGGLSWMNKHNLRHHLHQMFVASILAMIGTGLMTLFNGRSAKSVWISFQAMLGIGVGIGIYTPATSFAAVFIRDKHKLSAYLAITFIDALSASVFHSVAQSIFVNTLHSGLKARLPGFDTKVLMHTGVTTFALTFLPKQQSLVLQAYNAALINVFHLGMCLCSFGIFGYWFWILRGRYKRRRASQATNNRASHAPLPNASVMTQIHEHSSLPRDPRLSGTLAVRQPSDHFGLSAKSGPFEDGLRIGRSAPGGRPVYSPGETLDPAEMQSGPAEVISECPRPSEIAAEMP
jgi:hypothetical protein